MRHVSTNVATITKDQHGVVWISSDTHVLMLAKKVYNNLSPLIPYDELPILWNDTFEDNDDGSYLSDDGCVLSGLPVHVPDRPPCDPAPNR